MKVGQYIALLDSDRDGLLFDLKAKAHISGNKKLVEKLNTLNGGDSAEILGELQMMGALPDLEPDGVDETHRESSSIVFPTEVFPSWFANMVEQVAECVQVDVSHAAQDARMALNALVGPGVDYKINEDWQRHAGLYLCIIGESGTGKSRCSRHTMKCLYAFQDEISRASKGGMSNARIDQSARDAQKAQLESQLKSACKPSADGAINLGAVSGIKRQLSALNEEHEEHAAEAVEPTFWETDVTSEYLLQCMVQNGGQLSLVGAESPLFALLSGRYSQGVLESVEVFNDAFDGSPVSAGRVKRERIVCMEPRLACSIGTQPCVLFKTRTSTTLLERGTLARFSFFEPPTRLGTRDMKIKHIDPVVRDEFNRTMRSLGLAFRGEPPVEGHPFTRKPPTVFTFLPEAVTRFEQWRQLREAERQEGGRLRRLTGFQARIDDLLPRNAAQLHALWYGLSGGHNITKEMIERAAKLTEFDIQATDAVFSKMGLDTIARLADAIEDWATTEKIIETTIQKLTRVSLGMPKSTDQVRAACLVLAKEGFLALTKETKKKGGRPSERITFNYPF
jgi:hypothetical protein